MLPPAKRPAARSSTKLAAQRTASSRQAHGALRTSVRAPEAAGKNSPAATEWGQRSRRGITGACGVGGGTGQYSELYTICMRTQVLHAQVLGERRITRGQHERFAGVLLRWPRSRQRCVRPGLGSRTHHAAPIPAEAIERASRLVKAPSPPRCDPIGECAIAKREPPIEQAAPRISNSARNSSWSARGSRKETSSLGRLSHFAGKDVDARMAGRWQRRSVFFFFGGLDAAVRGTKIAAYIDDVADYAGFCMGSCHVTGRR